MACPRKAAIPIVLASSPNRAGTVLRQVCIFYLGSKYFKNISNYENYSIKILKIAYKLKIYNSSCKSIFILHYIIEKLLFPNFLV